MNPNGIPSQAEFGLLRAYLAQNQMSQSQIDEAIGIVPNGRTRAEIANELRAWLASL
jgi:hypothetical protein